MSRHSLSCPPCLIFFPNGRLGRPMPPSARWFRPPSASLHTFMPLRQAGQVPTPCVSQLRQRAHGSDDSAGSGALNLGCLEVASRTPGSSPCLCITCPGAQETPWPPGGRCHYLKQVSGEAGGGCPHLLWACRAQEAGIPERGWELVMNSSLINNHLGPSAVSQAPSRHLRYNT